MLRIEPKQIEVREEQLLHHSHRGEGLLFLGALTASWVIAVALGWLVWRLSPL